MRFRNTLAVLLAASFMLCASFAEHTDPAAQTAEYYDQQLDSFSRAVSDLSNAVVNGASRQALKSRFLTCRLRYKRAELFVDIFDPLKARLLNGADQLKLEEENPGDSLKPHGLQVVEGILYGRDTDTGRLRAEIASLASNIKALRSDPDRRYYFKNERIWLALRLGVYRIISLGLTGFDGPYSDHAILETRSVLMSVRVVASFYKSGIPARLYARQQALFTRATAFLDRNPDFITFDRITFIRDYLNPISEWLSECVHALGYIDRQQRSPLNPDAATLFSAGIMDIDFFSPNNKFKLTYERAALGKLLFYDTKLSGNGARSCGSCHVPAKAFTDGLPKPYDLNGNKILARNTPTLWNSALQTRQFYDSRTETLENQLSAVVHNADEMAGSLKKSIPILAGDTAYVSRFRSAYGDMTEPITEYTIANAIASYVRTLISMDSRFDRYMRRQTDQFTAAEQHGFNLFMGKARCGTCHYAPVFNGLVPPLYQETESEAPGVPATATHATLDPDPGLFNFTRVPLHRHFFKTPTVRNIALTGPYMHNGAFKTLEEVLSFYNTGGGAGMGIDFPGQTLPADSLKLSRLEIQHIVSFLRTLTDTSQQYKLLPFSGKS